MDDLADGCGQERDKETPSRLKTDKRAERKQKNRGGSQNQKPWRNPGADITDYFNYSFTEESWKSYCQKQREMRVAMRNLVDRHSQHQEERIRPSSACDSRGLYPRCHRDSCRNSSQDWWTIRSRKASSSTEDRATHLFTSPDSTCPCDPEARTKRSRDRKKHRERQPEEKQPRKSHDQAKTSTSHKQQEQDKDRDRQRKRGHRRQGDNRGDKRRR